MTAPKPARGIRVRPHLSETFFPGSNPAVELPIASIRLDRTIQQRAGGVSNAVLNDYALSIGEWIHRVPVTVYRDPSGACVLADGFHRVAAAKLAGLQHIHCTVLVGGYREALLFACGANATHGARRTAADKRRAVETLLHDAEWCQWSNRRIAEQIGVDHKTVGTIRAQLGKFPSCASPATAADALPTAGAVGGSREAPAMQTAAPVDTAKPAGALPVDLAPLPLERPTATEPAAAPAQKRIGKDGKARAAPTPKTPEPGTDTDPGYCKVHAISAGKLFKKAEQVSIAIGYGEPLDETLKLLREAIATADGLLNGLLILQDRRDRAQAADRGEGGAPWPV
jgi:ParB-like chromosome segregation protein Spo0J